MTLLWKCEIKPRVLTSSKGSSLAHVEQLSATSP